ncbi:hypothetical protein E3E12_07985 [Formicincola oecophyllae]|uniref:Uncharacterized protein n=1 Tax=Formicincola oecophyllae TaxID=2558361 RepID=A0A4Y6UDN6_9PROT|nr:hypothetical protein [Formicincola oecophyllae]QDH14135.1 hypothetical protein E3E12_07985 [Formicincola oecophyllae]
MAGTVFTSTSGGVLQGFRRKGLRVTFTVGSGSLGPDATMDSVVLENHRCHATITQEGMRTGLRCELTLEGMEMAEMNRLSMLAPTITLANSTVRGLAQNSLTVEVVDNISPPELVFSGQVLESFADYGKAPEVTFQVRAQANAGLGAAQAAPLSYPQPVAAAQVVADIAARAGVRCADHGLKGTFGAGYTTHGTLLDMVERAVGAFHGAFMRDAAGTLHVWGTEAPKAGGGAPVPLLNAASGLLGYPSYTASGLQVRSLFRGDVEWWQPINVQGGGLGTPGTQGAHGLVGNASQGAAGWAGGQGAVRAPPWNGLWVPWKITHELTTEIKDGPWFTTLEAQRAEGSVNNAQ